MVGVPICTEGITCFLERTVGVARDINVRIALRAALLTYRTSELPSTSPRNLSRGGWIGLKGLWTRAGAAPRSVALAKEAQRTAADVPIGTEYHTWSACLQVRAIRLLIVRGGGACG